MQIEEIKKKYKSMIDDLEFQKENEKQLLSAGQGNLEYTLMELKSHQLTMESRLKHSHQV